MSTIRSCALARAVAPTKVRVLEPGTATKPEVLLGNYPIPVRPARSPEQRAATLLKRKATAYAKEVASAQRLADAEVRRYLAAKAARAATQ